MLCTSPFGACGRQNTPSPPPQEGHIPVPNTYTHILFHGKRALCRCDSWFSQRLAWIMTHKNPTESLRILTKRETRGSGVSEKHIWQLKQSWSAVITGRGPWANEYRQPPGAQKAKDEVLVSGKNPALSTSCSEPSETYFRLPTSRIIKFMFFQATKFVVICLSSNRI